MCVGMKVGCVGMEWVTVLCLLSGEWWPGGVPIRWTGALDWTTGLDYWTRVILCKSVNDVITNRPPSCVVRVASIGSLCEWI